MASQFIGAIVGSVTGNVYAIINPDEDSELDNPRHLLLQAGTEDREPMLMVRIARGDYMGALSMDDVAALVAQLINRQ